MKTKMIWCNLAVEDLKRTSNFYTQLGFRPNNPNTSNELVSFFVSENNFIIHFFLKDRLKAGINGEIADLSKGNEVVFSLSAESKEEVEEWQNEVVKAGGTIYVAPHKVDKGYNVGFSDPDGHKFNVLYWPK